MQRISPYFILAAPEDDPKTKWTVLMWVRLPSAAQQVLDKFKGEGGISMSNSSGF